MKKIKSFTDSYKMIQDLSASDRARLIEITFDNIKRGGDIDDQVVPECDEMVKALKRDFKFIGFSPNLMYLKARGPKDDLEATYIHPWAMTTLIFKHKTLPFLIHINAAMEWDESFLSKIPQNHELFEGRDLKGGTG